MNCLGSTLNELAILEPITESLPFVGLLSVSELTFEQVVKILEVSIAIGIVHLLLAFFLRLHADIKQHNKKMVLYHDIPTIIQYLAVVSLILQPSDRAMISSVCLASQARLIQSQYRG